MVKRQKWRITRTELSSSILANDNLVAAFNGVVYLLDLVLGWQS